MTNDTKAVLTYLDRVLARGDQTSVEVAKILAALRGPDAYTPDGYKQSTTTLIRALAFPTTAGFGVLATGWDFTIAHAARLGVPRVLPNIGINPTFSTGHFLGHIKDAAAVLGLPFQLR